MEQKTWKADLALASIALIWGATFVVVKDALNDISPLLFLSLRFTLATAALAIIFRPIPGKFVRPKLVITGGIAAGLCLFASYALQTFGLLYTTPSKSAFLTGLCIVMVPIFGAAIHRRVPHAWEVMGIGTAMTGMALMTFQGGFLQINRGDLLTIACAAGFAAHILAVGQLAPRVGFGALSLVQIATAAVLASATFWWAETPVIQWRPAVVAAIIITGLLATALAFSVQAWAQKYTSANRAAAIFALEPVFASITSFLLMGEILSLRAAAGACLILAGILIVELKPVPPLRHH